MAKNVKNIPPAQWEQLSNDLNKAINQELISREDIEALKGLVHIIGVFERK